MKPPAAWLASFVRRWHQNPALCHTIDPIGGHGARMAILALHKWKKPSRKLLIACIVHDLGEAGPGDVSSPAKKANPEFAGMLDVLEGRARKAMGMDYKLGKRDLRRLKYLDRLDAYLWAMHHKPKLRKLAEWKAARKELESYDD